VRLNPMSEYKGQATATEKTTDQSAKTKRPYTKPSFREERVFETMALSCGKLATQGQCQIHPMNS
ncbi:MAG: hypothetical protein WBC66_14405, partial [Candidatus Acidiferrales bacterium]